MSVTLTAQTPAQIDTAFVEILIRADRVGSRAGAAAATIRDYAPGGKYNRRGDSLNFYDQQRVTDAEASLPALQAEYRAIMAEGDPHRAEYARRGYWTRYAICKSDGGHVHRFEGGDPRVCSTLRKGYGDHDDQHASVMGWLPEYSGLTPDELIEAVGYTACTVCFPQAPVSAAWKRTEAAAKRATADTRLAKWQSGRDLRAKKVASTEKTYARHVARGDHAHCLSYRDGECWDERAIGYAKQELARWDEKRPGGSA